MTAEIDAAKVVVSLLGRENRVDVKEASERLRQIAGEARSQGVETERRIEAAEELGKRVGDVAYRERIPASRTVAF